MKIKYLIPFLLLFVFCKPKYYSKIVGKKWWHINELDTEKIQFYKAEPYQIPTSRGRNGFEFRKENKAIINKIAPSCGIEGKEAHWNVKKKLISIESETEKFQFKIIEVNDSVMLVEKIK